MARYQDEQVRWATPRPGFMREIEPGSSAWHSLPVNYIDRAEATFNRQLFAEGRNRKPPAKAAAPAAEGQQTGSA